jgi:hypothetical protein
MSKNRYFVVDAKGSIHPHTPEGGFKLKRDAVYLWESILNPWWHVEKRVEDEGNTTEPNPSHY